MDQQQRRNRIWNDHHISLTLLTHTIEFRCFFRLLLFHILLFIWITYWDVDCQYIRNIYKYLYIQARNVLHTFCFVLDWIVVFQPIWQQINTSQNSFTAELTSSRWNPQLFYVFWLPRCFIFFYSSSSVRCAQ